MRNRKGSHAFRTLSGALIILTAAAAGAGPLDPDDRAKVEEIDAKVDDLLDVAADLQSAADGIIAVSEEEDKDLRRRIDYNKAQLRMHVERMMIDACAWKCSQRPLPPLGRSNSVCWSCASPRLMMTRDDGGYLEDVLLLVDEAIKVVDSAGLPMDIARAAFLLERALEALAAGDGEESFTLACQAYGTLSCEESAGEGVTGAAAEAVPAAAPAGGIEAATADLAGPPVPSFADPDLIVLGFKIDALATQLGIAGTKLDLANAQAEARKPVEEQAFFDLTRNREREIERELLACALHGGKCLPPFYLTSTILDPLCTEFETGSHGDHVHDPGFACPLREVIEIVREVIEGAEAAGLDRDLGRAQAEVDAAIAAAIAGDGREAYARACDAFRAVACR